jgi:hypothetical protein
MDDRNVRQHVDEKKRKDAYDALSPADQVAFEPDDPRLEAYMEIKARGELAKRYADGRITEDEKAILKYYAPDVLSADDRDPDLAYRMKSNDVQANVDRKAREAALAVLPESLREGTNVDERMGEYARDELFEKYKNGTLREAELKVMQYYCPERLSAEHRNHDLLRGDVASPTVQGPDATRPGEPSWSDRVDRWFDNFSV